MPNRQASDKPSEPELTEAERKALRELLEADRRVKWLWASARTIALWITAAAAAGTVLIETFRKAVQSVGKG